LILLHFFTIASLAGYDMLSTQQKIERLEALVGTHDVGAWESGFIETLVRYKKENNLAQLSDKQLEIMQSIFNKHFAA
jgi:hypothetical protein